jgi:hypothetical protein
VKYDGKEVPVTAGTLLWDTTSMRQVNANTLTEERTSPARPLNSGKTAGIDLAWQRCPAASLRF